MAVSMLHVITSDDICQLDIVFTSFSTCGYISFIQNAARSDFQLSTELQYQAPNLRRFPFIFQ